MKTSLKSLLPSAALVTVLTTLWIWSNPGQDQVQAATLNNKTVEELLHEVRSLKSKLAELKWMNSNIVASTSSELHSDIDTEALVEQMREMIRSELNTIPHQVSRDYSEIDSRQIADPKRQSEAENASVIIIDSVIANGGALSDIDRSRLGEMSPYLSEQVKNELRHRIVMAINRQELQFQESLDLPF